MSSPLTVRRLLALALLCIGLGATPAYALVAIGKASISGQILDTDGLPIAGVSVKVKGPLPILFSHKTLTNPGGFYTLSGLSPEQKVQVSFEKAGFAPSQGSVSLQRQNHGKFHPQLLVKMRAATLNKTLLASGAVQRLDASKGGALSEAGFKVTFGPNSLTTQGNNNVDVVISPIDVSTNAVTAAPGDYSARTSQGRPVQLESFSMADFSLSTGDRKVNLKPGATADIELLLPANTPLSSGDETPMWHFDTAKGLWQEEGRGRVDQSTQTPNRLAVFATVSHFSWWNSDQPIATTQITGRVIDTQGRPVSAASVGGRGLDYAGTSPTVLTDVNGVYCLPVKSTARSAVTASLLMSGLRAESIPLPIDAGVAGNSCANGTAQQVADIVMPTAFACVQGNVRDENNQAVAGVTVYASSGSYTTTDSSGSFRFQTFEQTRIQVLTAGYPALSVQASSADAPCAIAELRPGTGTSDQACVTGMVYQCQSSNPLQGLEVEVRHAVTNDVLARSLPTDANGMYCIEGLPARQDVLIDPNPNGSMNHSVQLNSGNGGGSCATQTCNAVPAMDIWCY